mmetsp:Transcript_11430/g.20536  ORF Transcript_11430/g.20536 Transcript_11430/m.20536 type:complete len:202 (-) Transcript_11430:644-1249(-)
MANPASPRRRSRHPRGTTRPDEMVRGRGLVRAVLRTRHGRRVQLDGDQFRVPAYFRRRRGRAGGRRGDPEGGRRGGSIDGIVRREGRRGTGGRRRRRRRRDEEEVFEGGGVQARVESRGGDRGLHEGGSEIATAPRTRVGRRRRGRRASHRRRSAAVRGRSDSASAGIDVAGCGECEGWGVGGADRGGEVVRAEGYGCTRR